MIVQELQGVGNACSLQDFNGFKARDALQIRITTPGEPFEEIRCMVKQSMLRRARQYQGGVTVIRQEV